MKSAARGKSTSADVEVTNVSARGIWILLGDREVFMAFKNFPWFKHASIGEVLNVEWPSPNHLYWPELDVDLAVESIDDPAKYPLVSAVRPNNRVQPPCGTPGARQKRRAARG